MSLIAVARDCTLNADFEAQASRCLNVKFLTGISSLHNIKRLESVGGRAIV